MSSDLYLPVFLLSSSFFFRRLISELVERNSTTIGHMVGSKCNLKTHVEYLRYPLPLQMGGPKPAFFGRLRNLTTNSTACLPSKTRYRRSVKCVDNYKGSPTLSQNVMNFGPQTASNATAIFTHPPSILHSASLPGFADGHQQTELNNTLPSNGYSKSP